jgi:hypothetical protein
LQYWRQSMKHNWEARRSCWQEDRAREEEG